MPDQNASSDDKVSMAFVEEIEKRWHLMIQGKNISATDALASVDGFRILVHLTRSHLFGMMMLSNLS